MQKVMNFPSFSQLNLVRTSTSHLFEFVFHRFMPPLYFVLPVANGFSQTAKLISFLVEPGKSKK
jgi:hypothetical protein